MKKLIVTLGLACLFCFCAYLLNKMPKESTVIQDDEEVTIVQEAKLPETLFTFKKDEFTAECSGDNIQLCAIEQAIKCTISPNLEECQKAKQESTLPQFIFITDSGTDRPSEISYKFTDKKLLNNQTVEYYTDSTCNGTWFGLCHGRIIYVLTPNSKGWMVKDIYAIELEENQQLYLL